MAIEPSTLGPMSDINRVSLNESADKLRETIDQCLDCYQSCQQLIFHCLQLGGAHADPAHIKLLQDCSTITATTAKLMIRGSDFYNKLCELCSEICLVCARDCERFDDEAMRHCAEICRNCASSCQTAGQSH